MPSIKHEGLLQPFQHRPSLAAELLTEALGVKLPDWQRARLGPSDLTDLVPTEYRADTVVELYSGQPWSSRRPGTAMDTPVQADHPRRRQVLAAFGGAMRTVDRDRATVYHDVVSATLPEAARRYLERLMSTGTYQFQSEFALRHIKQGKIEGEASALLTVLASRGVDVPDEARDRITRSTDLGELDQWLRRAVTADSVDDLFLDED